MDPPAGGPPDPAGAAAGAGNYGNQPPAIRKSPSLMDMFKGLNPSSKKGARAEIQQQKRRGPKPDSRPAQTRRQELNRQAQRTHRERKEQYIRSLEVQISQLREGYSGDITNANMTIFQQRQALEEAKSENQLLRQILTANGIPFEAELEQRKPHPGPTSQVSSFPDSAPQSVTFSGTGRPHGSTPETSLSPGRSPLAFGSDPTDPSESGATHGYHGAQGHQAASAAPGDSSGQAGGNDAVTSDVPGIFEQDPQLGIDFILNLEDPCRPHMERLCRRAHDDKEQETPAGHILMATCPPPSIVSTAERGQPYSFQTYDLPHPNLDTLLNLSKQLVTKDEVTPIMALQSLKNHEMYPSLTRDDVVRMMDDLQAKIRCYGFGAVLEEFEFMDCISRLYASKMETDLGTSWGPPKPLPPDIHPRVMDETMYS